MGELELVHGYSTAVDVYWANTVVLGIRKLSAQLKAQRYLLLCSR